MSVIKITFYYITHKNNHTITASLINFKGELRSTKFSKRHFSHARKPKI